MDKIPIIPQTDTVKFKHPWPFPVSNGKKVIVPKIIDKKKLLKKDYPDALF